MGLRSRNGTRRYARIVISLAVALVLVGCGGLGLLPYQTDIQNTKFHSFKQMTAAYDRMQAGVTRISDLTDIGFDRSSPNVEMLSYLGLIERFMPRDSARFDHLAPAVQDCIAARDRCTALVFRPERVHQQRTGNWMLDVLGFKRTAINYGWSAEVVLLVEDGRVAYKAMSGQPNLQNDRGKVQTLGAFQDFSGAVMRTASSAANL